MEEQSGQKDSGFSIDDILHEKKTSNPIKRHNTPSNLEVYSKRDKPYEDNEKYYPSCLEVESEVSNIFGMPKFGESNQDNSNPNAGFGIAQLLSSKDSFLAKSIVVHDTKSNLSKKGMNFLEKSNENVNDDMAETVNISSNVSEGATVKDEPESEFQSNLFMPAQLDQPLHSNDQLQLTGEENERTLVDVTCKLFLFDKETNSWNNIGMVNLHVNEYVRKEDDPSDKFYTRVIARSLSLQKPVLNFKLWPNIVLDLPTENTILMQASYMNDLENIRFISLSMKPATAHCLWKTIRNKSEELNNFVAKKALINEYRATHDDHSDLDDDQLYELISEKPPTRPAKKIRLLDSKKTFQSVEDSSISENEADDESTSAESFAPSAEEVDEQPNNVNNDTVNSAEGTVYANNNDPNENEIMVNGTIINVIDPADGDDISSQQDSSFTPNDEINSNQMSAEEHLNGSNSPSASDNTENLSPE